MADTLRLERDLYPVSDSLSTYKRRTYVSEHERA
jgi:hypothetical protein